MDQVINKPEKKKIKPKTKKFIHSCVRAGIQLLFFIFLPSAFSSAFAAVKYIFTQIGISEQIRFVPFIQVLLVLIVFTVIFGRFFCGFACAFGALGDWLHLLYQWICKKRKKKPLAISPHVAHYLSYIKYAILLAIVVCCFTGVYGKLGKWNPWTVFSLLRAGNFRLEGFLPGIIIFGLILVGMFFCERFFCGFLCPMGAIFSLLPIFPIFTIRRNREACIKGCSQCKKNCPANIDLPDKEDWNVAGDCFQCQKCIGACPKGNISGSRLHLKGNEIWLTIARAVLLAGLMVLVGIG